MSRNGGSPQQLTEWGLKLGGTLQESKNLGVKFSFSHGSSVSLPGKLFREMFYK